MIDIDVSAVFDRMDQALAVRGFGAEDGREHPEAFGSRWRLYRRTPREAVSLTWDGKEAWFVVAGGVPWRELALYRVEHDQGYEPASVVGTLLGEVAHVPDYDPAI
jgi:hypothetical protein